MKKFIIIAAVLIAVAVGVYFYKNKSADGESITDTIAKTFSSSSSDNVVLEYVPADSVFFVGSPEPLSYEKSMEISRNMGFDFATFAALADTSDMQADANDPEAAKFLIGFFKEYLSAIGDDFPNKFGIANQMNIAAYTVGVLPVIRIELDGSDTFAQLINKIDSDNSLEPKNATIDGVSYREYSFDTRPNTNNPAPLLVVSTHNNQAVITVNTILADDKDLKAALGINKPATSILSANTLSSLMNKHDYKGASLIFIDNLGIVKGLTDPKANSFGTMLSEVMTAYGDADEFAHMQTPECKAEYTALVSNWPMISAGYTELSDDKASYKFILEGANADLLESLQKLRGHLSPALNDSDYLFSMGMGFNVAELTPVITDVWKRLTKEPYSCAPLAAMQAEMKQTNPMMQLGMMTGMVSGIKGLGFAVVDFDAEGMQAMQSNPMAAADALNMFVTLSADEPMALVQTVAGFVSPELAQLELEDGGEAKVLPLPLPVQVKAALRGHDLVFAFGAKAEAIVADMKSNTDLTQNGLMSFSMDMGRYMSLISQVAGEAGELSAEDKKALEVFKGIKGQVVETFDFTDNGFEIQADMKIK